MNKMACVDPMTGERVREAARRTNPLLAPLERRHLEACDDCRVFVERTRRMAEAWRALAPADVELAAATARFHARRTRRRGVIWGVPRAVAAALVLAVVASAAAQIAVKRWSRPAPAPAAHEDRRAPVRSGHRRAIAREAPPPTTAPAPAATTVVEPLPAPQPPPPVVAPPVVVGETPAPAGRAIAERRVIHRRLPARSHAASRAALEPATISVPPDATGSDWKEAAAALRDGDREGAERALDRLATALDARTRDAARLARAQLWLSGDRVPEARAELEDLAATGATALVRRQAAHALRN